MITNFTGAVLTVLICAIRNPRFFVSVTIRPE
jgi:hypothetical protein